MKIRIVRKTDQWNNEDFAAGSRVFTISHVTEGKEQVPYDIHFSDGEGRCWRPSNGMLELLWHLWGDDSKAWEGRRVELFQDATVKIGRDVVGGIRVRSMSNINKTMSPLITVSRGTKKPYTVQPLPDEVKRDWFAELEAVNDTTALSALYAEVRATPGANNETLYAAFGARGATIKAAQATTADGEELI